MQLKMMIVDGLFGQYKHTVPFPVRDEDNPDPSLTLLCGENGVGKTRLLRMLNGFMTLNFTPFREVPFKSAALTFSDDTSISVRPTHRTVKKEQLKCLRVKYSCRPSGEYLGPKTKPDTSIFVAPLATLIA